jgi:hypothetical protein
MGTDRSQQSGSFGSPKWFLFPGPIPHVVFDPGLNLSLVWQPTTAQPHTKILCIFRKFLSKRTIKPNNNPPAQQREP